MSEREHSEAEPKKGSTFIRPFQEKVTSFWRWITFQETPQVEIQAQRPEIPSVSMPFDQAPRYNPRQAPLKESSQRAREGSKRNPEKRQVEETDIGGDIVESAWWLHHISEGGHHSSDNTPSQPYQSDSGSHRGRYDSGDHSAPVDHGHSSGGGGYDGGGSSGGDSGGGGD